MYDTTHAPFDQANPIPWLFPSSSSAVGQFLVNESAEGEFRLFVKHTTRSKRYRIRTCPDGSCYVLSKSKFKDVKELVGHYQHDADGLCVQLTTPCQAIPQRKPVENGPACVTRSKAADEDNEGKNRSPVVPPKDYFAVEANPKPRTRGPPPKLHIEL